MVVRQCGNGVGEIWGLEKSEDGVWGEVGIRRLREGLGER